MEVYSYEERAIKSKKNEKKETWYFFYNRLLRILASFSRPISNFPSEWYLVPEAGDIGAITSDRYFLKTNLTSE